VRLGEDDLVSRHQVQVALAEVRLDLDLALDDLQQRFCFQDFLLLLGFVFDRVDRLSSYIGRLKALDDLYLAGSSDYQSTEWAELCSRSKYSRNTANWLCSAEN
jgi:hypothetical protein